MVSWRKWGDRVGVRTRWQRPFPSRSPPRAAPAALAARPPAWPCPAARAGGRPVPDRAGPPRGWAPPGTPWQGLRQAGGVGRVGRPQAWAPASAGWQGVGGRGRVGLPEQWLYFFYTLFAMAAERAAKTVALLTELWGFLCPNPPDSLTRRLFLPKNERVAEIRPYGESVARGSLGYSP